MCEVETNYFYPFEDIAPSTFSEVSIFTAISFDEETGKRKRVVQDPPKLPENACNLSLVPELKVSLKACCKNGWARLWVGKLIWTLCWRHSWFCVICCNYMQINKEKEKNSVAKSKVSCWTLDCLLQWLQTCKMCFRIKNDLPLPFYKLYKL